jgi:hypothetical protein
MDSHVEDMPHQSWRRTHTKTAKTFIEFNVVLEAENECGDSRKLHQLAESFPVGGKVVDRNTLLFVEGKRCAVSQTLSYAACWAAALTTMPNMVKVQRC